MAKKKLWIRFLVILVLIDYIRGWNKPINSRSSRKRRATDSLTE